MYEFAKDFRMKTLIGLNPEFTQLEFTRRTRIYHDDGTRGRTSTCCQTEWVT